VKLVSSSSNTISANNITENNSAGIMLISSSFNNILLNTITNNTCGVKLENSSNSNTISQNKIADSSNAGVDLFSFDLLQENNSIFANEMESNRYGVHLLLALNTTIKGNNIENNTKGLVIYRSLNITITENNLADNSDHGIYLDTSYDSRIYHNNLINNDVQWYFYSSINTWSAGYPYGGNFWSDYNGTDLSSGHYQNETGSDGIGDTPYLMPCCNEDNYPLMGLFHSFDNTLRKPVKVISNSSVTGFEHEPTGTIRFHVSNMTENQTHGFCRVTMPYDVLSPPFNVKVNGANPTYVNTTLHDDGTHRWIYFEYEHSTREIVIITEFPSLFILQVFMVVTLMAAVARIRKR